MSFVSVIDVVGIGENSVDYVYLLPQLPSPAAKLPISARRVSLGGQVATTACACAKLGLRTKYVGCFGNDDAGKRLREELIRRNVDIGDASLRNAPNRYAVILVDERTGERIVLWQRDAAMALTPRDIAADMFAGARLLHVDGVDEAAAIAAARMARGGGVRVSCDVDRVTAQTPSLLEQCDVIVLAEHVPLALTGEADAAVALRQLHARYGRWVVVTLGNRGAMLMADGELHSAPAFTVKAVDTTGAGDVFRAGVIHALLRGEPPASVLRFANAAAAVSCTRPGAIDSIPSLDEIGQLLRV